MPLVYQQPMSPVYQQSMSPVFQKYLSPVSSPRDVKPIPAEAKNKKPKTNPPCVLITGYNSPNTKTAKLLAYNAQKTSNPWDGNDGRRNQIRQISNH
jgi:hypothetical protein